MKQKLWLFDELVQGIQENRVAKCLELEKWLKKKKKKRLVEKFLILERKKKGKHKVFREDKNLRWRAHVSSFMLEFFSHCLPRKIQDWFTFMYDLVNTVKLGRVFVYVKNTSLIADKSKDDI